MKYEDLELRTLKGNKVIIKSPEEGSEIGVIGGAWIEGLGETNASTLGFCSGASLRAWSSFKGFENMIDPDASYECFKFTSPVDGAACLDKASTDALREFKRALFWARIEQAGVRAQEETAAEEAAIPGLRELRAAYDAEEKYRSDCATALEDEMRDGVNIPVAPRTDIDALAAQYPRANLYLKAEGYADASHYAKASAGRKAMTLLREGGTIEEAAAILDGWLSDVYVD